MIRAVAFDLWETLITDTPELARTQETLRIEGITRVLRAAGHTAGDADIRRAYHELWTRCHDLYWSNDLDIPTRTQIVHFLEALAIDPTSISEELLARMDHAYAVPALDILPAAVTGAIETVRRLGSQGMAIGVVSNTGRTPGYILRGVLDRLGFAGSIRTMLFSNEHGECKPKPSIFDALCEGLALPAEDVVFVGDNLYCDVYGAQQCGMTGIHFNPEEKGLAVAPPTTRRFDVIPDATIERLQELPPLIAELRNRRAPFR